MARVLVSARTAGDSFDVHQETIRRLARDGRIPMYRVGRYMRFDLDEIRAALRADSSPSGSGVVSPDFDALDAA
jgi:excisionase family DNA binding protein